MFLCEAKWGKDTVKNKSITLDIQCKCLYLFLNLLCIIFTFTVPLSNQIKRFSKKSKSSHYYNQEKSDLEEGELAHTEFGLFTSEEEHLFHLQR